MSDSPVEVSEQVMADLTGRIVALQVLVTRLFASHADMFPEGVASRMLSEVDAVVDSLDRTMSPGIVQEKTKIYVRYYLDEAQDALDLGLSTNQAE